MNPSTLVFVLLLACGFARAPLDAAEPEQPTVECRWTTAPITIDGRADELAWAKAQVIERFVTPWLPDDPPGKTATKARLLWDAEALYFHAEMTDGDLFADIVEHDGLTWENDVFELFFKPDAAKAGYYEFQVTPAGTTFDMFIPTANNEASFVQNVSRDTFTWQTRVVRRGTLNERGDRDDGWSAEGRIPWVDLIHTGARPLPDETWRFALCRYDYDKQWPKPNLSTTADFTKVSFHQTERYAPLKFIGPTEAEIPPFGLTARVPLTTSTVVGSPDPPPPYHTVRAFEKLTLLFPIMVRAVPQSDMLLALIKVEKGNGTKLVRFRDDPNVAEFEELHTFDGVAYDLTFHPRFAENGYVYVGWSDPVEGKPRQGMCRVSRFTVDRAAPHEFHADSELQIIEWPSAGHNGCAVAFGNDGMFFVTSGDGTSDSDTDVVGQDMTRLTAKLLRIDVDGATDADRAAGRNYAVPKDNPFVNLAGARPETWAYGFRNPWRMAVDPQTGHVWVTQNGQDLWEQVYFVRRGENYGWSVTEGGHPFYLERKRGPTPIIPPTVEHSHSEARSLTGGVVYHGTKYEGLRGAYLYGDHSTGKIWAVRHDGERVAWHREIADTTLAITAISLDTRGELLVADYRGGKGDEAGGLFRLEPTPPAAPSTFPRRLSESGLFVPGKGHTAAPGVVPYTVNSPLWSDGAYKERFLAIPGEGVATYTPRRPWTLPDETVLIKSFALEMTAGDPSSRRWIETRFLTKQAGEWIGYTYEWNDEQTDAVLVDAAAQDRTFEIVDAEVPGGKRTQTWHLPSRAECMMCHSRAAGYVLGVSTPQLNCEQDYGGVRDNQLRALTNAGLLKGIEASEWRDAVVVAIRNEGRSQRGADDYWLKLSKNLRSPSQRKLPVKSPFGVVAGHYDRLVDPYDAAAPAAARVRSYLHANCAHCHVSAGGGNSRLELSFWTPDYDTQMIDALPVHTTFGLSDARVVASGRPESSVLLHRLAGRERGFMPPLATSQVDREAVDLFRQWIAALPPPRKPTRAEEEL